MDVRYVEFAPAHEDRPQELASHDLQTATLPTTDAPISQSATSKISDHTDYISGRSLGVSLVNRAIFYLIALLLVLTAIAKLWMLITDSFAEVRVGIAKEILWISVGFELWLAFENFRIRDQRVLAFINTIVFATFAVFAGSRWWLGYGTCGCSGKIEIPSWVFLLLDVAVVAWFTATQLRRRRARCGMATLAGWWRGLSSEKRGKWVGLTLFLGYTGGMQLPAVAPLRAIFNGEQPIKAVVQIDRDLIVGQRTSGIVTIQNSATQAGKIVGVSRSCGCFQMAEASSAKVIPALGSLEIPLEVNPFASGRMHQRIVLYLDHPEQFRLNIDFFGFAKE